MYTTTRRLFGFTRSMPALAGRSYHAEGPLGPFYNHPNFHLVHSRILINYRVLEACLPAKIQAITAVLDATPHYPTGLALVGRNGLCYMDDLMQCDTQTIHAFVAYLHTVTPSDMEQGTPLTLERFKTLTPEEQASLSKPLPADFSRYHSSCGS